MSRVLIPADDALFLQWVENFATEAVANATALGLTTGQTTTLTSLATAFGNAYAASQASKVTTKSLIGGKDAMRSACEGQFRSVAKVINADVNISATLKGELGISIGPSPSNPVTWPSNLTVVGLENGVNSLRWKRNGNAKGTIFIIESKSEDAANWTILTSLTALKYDHMGQVPGVRVSYRISAKRGNVQSAPCAAVSVYDETETTVLVLNQAA